MAINLRSFITGLAQTFSWGYLCLWHVKFSVWFLIVDYNVTKRAVRDQGWEPHLIAIRQSYLRLLFLCYHVSNLYLIFYDRLVGCTIHDKTPYFSASRTHTHIITHTHNNLACPFFCRVIIKSYRYYCNIPHHIDM